MNTRDKGNRFEREVKKQLEKLGFFVCNQKSSRFPDLIAISPSKDIYFIECKTNKYISKTEKEKLLTQPFGEPFFAYPVIIDRKKNIVYEDLSSDFNTKIKDKTFLNELPYC